MRQNATVTLILVVRNEESGVETVVPHIPMSAFDDCYAIDGHSSDSTVSKLEDFGVRVFLQDRPGLGAAMMCGRQRARTDAIVFFHPDGNENPVDLPKMARLLRQGREFVVASRMIAGARNEEDGHLWRPRKMANLGLAWLANLAFAHKGNRTTDVTNGFRGIACSAWDRMKLTSTDLTMDYQMVIHALKLQIPITEFATREGLRVGGQTNFASIPTGVAEMKLLLRELRIGRRCVDPN